MRQELKNKLNKALIDSLQEETELDWINIACMAKGTDDYFQDTFEVVTDKRIIEIKTSSVCTTDVKAQLEDIDELMICVTVYHYVGKVDGALYEDYHHCYANKQLIEELDNAYSILYCLGTHE